MRPPKIVMLLALVVSVLGAGCRARAEAGTPDLAPTGLTCATIQGCVEQCPLGAALTACANKCVARLVPAARPFYDALQKCVAPNCANRDAGGPCLDPSSMGCKLCAMSHCGSQASSCLLH